MFKQLIFLLLLMSSVIAQASAEQGCPYPSTIKYVAGRFQTSDKTVRWLSPKVEYRDFIDLFIGAVFTPGKGQERENGYMEKCLYRTGSGEVTALRPDLLDVVTNMSLKETFYWQLGTDVLDQPVYLCEDRQPDNCAFTVNDKRH
ncbi:DUF3757 domain-containing protein [Pseudomonas sp. MWU15-20650]|uniref:DUF3757 domain-containing protein n=1 Tax=Pseudomonas sp. MWU15-20650 TaxID=2933107 RepID=UPI0020105D29|nr:DUF3757 domain-containing protein [Pseudomonas sp. MWU15-20650]